MANKVEERKPCSGDPCFNPALAMQNVSGMNGARFGKVRDGGTRQHDGIDLQMAIGTPLFAMYDGYVVETGNRSGYGNCLVYLTKFHGQPIYIMYAHLRSVSVAVGDVIEAGDLIALSGNTGNLEVAMYQGGVKAHMHMEVREFDISRTFATCVRLDPEGFMGTEFGGSGRPLYDRGCHHAF
ncbi:MAG: M23 family metallopeptidase [Flavobacteriales bacterium]|nr:M23 family metallopeptidase [Flavobacteriales bacterium]